MISSVTAIFLLGLTSVLAQYKQYSPSPQPAAYRSPPAPQYAPAPQYSAAPQYAAAPLAKSANPEAAAYIVQEHRDVNFDGNFNYGFDSSNGLSVKSKGYLKAPVAANEPPIQAIEGSYSFVDQNGAPHTINYVADENGYRAYGDSIPQPQGPVPGAQQS